MTTLCLFAGPTRSTDACGSGAHNLTQRECEIFSAHYKLECTPTSVLCRVHKKKHLDRLLCFFKCTAGSTFPAKDLRKVPVDQEGQETGAMWCNGCRRASLRNRTDPVDADPVVADAAPAVSDILITESPVEPPTAAEQEVLFQFLALMRAGPSPALQDVFDRIQPVKLPKRKRGRPPRPVHVVEFTRPDSNYSALASGGGQVKKQKSKALAAVDNILRWCWT